MREKTNHFLTFTPSPVFIYRENPHEFREKPLHRCEKSRYFAPESRNKHVEQLKLYDYEEDDIHTDSSADNVSRS